MAQRKWGTRWSTRWRPPQLQIIVAAPLDPPAPPVAPHRSLAPAPPLSPFAGYIIERLTHDPPDDDPELARMLALAYYRERAQQFNVHQN